MRDQLIEQITVKDEETRAKENEMREQESQSIELF